MLFYSIFLCPENESCISFVGSNALLSKNSIINICTFICTPINYMLYMAHILTYFNTFSVLVDKWGIFTVKSVRIDSMAFFEYFRYI